MFSNDNVFSCFQIDSEVKTFTRYLGWKVKNTWKLSQFSILLSAMLLPDTPADLADLYDMSHDFVFDSDKWTCCLFIWFCRCYVRVLHLPHRWILFMKTMKYFCRMIFHILPLICSQMIPKFTWMRYVLRCYCKPVWSLYLWKLVLQFKGKKARYRF